MKKLLLSLILSACFFISNAQSPTISSFSPISGPVGTLLTIKGTNLASPTALTIGGTNAIVVSKSDTQLVGMVMPGTVTGPIALSNSQGAVSSSSTSNFTVIHTIYPVVQQSKLVGTGAVGNSNQGCSVAISADGNTAIVGGTFNAGAWVYVRNAGVWTQKGEKLVVTGGGVGIIDKGNSVAISADGNTVIVGGYNDNNNAGATWVFTRSAGVWTQQGSKLVGTGAVGNAKQGSSVALSADGNTAVVGGYNDNNLLGACWVFTRNAGMWTQQGNKLIW
jgi:hypothetical protein